MTVAEVRRKFNVTMAVTGRLQRSGERLRLELAAVDAATGRTLRTAVVDDSVSNLASFQDGLVLRVAGIIGLAPPRDAADRLKAMTTTMPEAFRSYLEATGILVGAADDADLDRAVALLETATCARPAVRRRVDRPGARVPAAIRGHATTPTRSAAHRPSAERMVKDGTWPDEALRLLAATETAGGRIPEAAAALERASRVAPANAEIHLELAAAYQAAARPADAEGELQRAIFLRPGYWLAHHLLAKQYLAQGRYEAAATQWREAIADAPECVYPYSNLGTVYYTLGRNDEARQAFEGSLAIEPSNARRSPTWGRCTSRTPASPTPPRCSSGRWRPTTPPTRPGGTWVSRTGRASPPTRRRRRSAGRSRWPRRCWRSRLTTSRSPPTSPTTTRCSASANEV